MTAADQGSAITPEQYADWMQHESDTRVPNIIACTAVSALLATVFLVLRFAGNWVQHRTLRPARNDWLVLAAWISFLVSIIFFALLTRYGGGRHMIFVTNKYMIQLCSILSEGFYGLAMGFLKLSILSLYSKIFPQRSFHYLLWAVTTFVVGWSLTTFLGSILQCVPMEKAYTPSLPGYCISYPKLSLTITVCNVLTDLIIMVLPIRLVMNLNATKKKKITIIISFVAGCGAVIVSIVRLVYALNVGIVDGTWNAIPAGYTSCIEMSLGFGVVSIPAYRSLVMRHLRRNNGSMTWPGRSSRSSKGLLAASEDPYSNSHYKVSGHKRGLSDGPLSTGGPMEMSNRGEKQSKTYDDGMGHTTLIAASQTNLPPVPGSAIIVTDQINQTQMPRTDSSWIHVPDGGMSTLNR